MLDTFHIAHGDVHTTYEARSTIDDTNLTVVAVVDFTGKSREAYRHERMYFHSPLAQMFEETVLHLPASNIIINQPNFHSCLRLVDQCIGDQSSQWIIFYDIGGDMDMVGCLANGREQSKKEFVSIGIDVGLTVFERKSPTLISKKVDQRTMLFRQHQVTLFRKF